MNLYHSTPTQNTTCNLFQTIKTRNQKSMYPKSSPSHPQVNLFSFKQLNRNPPTDLPAESKATWRSPWAGLLELWKGPGFPRQKRFHLVTKWGPVVLVGNLDPCFGGWHTPNISGQTGSRCIYIYIWYISVRMMFTKIPKCWVLFQ